MTGIQVFQTVAGTGYLMVVTIVAIRLLLLARRTRQLPEFLLGASLLIGGTFGATIEGASMSTAGDIPVETIGMMMLIGKLLGVVGMTMQVLFIRTVFRPQSKWALAAVFAIVGIISLPNLGFWIHGSFRTGEIPFLWQGVQFVGRMLAPIWMFCESVNYYGLMKRRLALGIASPLVTNRFLLWSIASVTGMMIIATSIPPTVLDPIAYELILSIDLLVFSVAGIATASCYWLALMPPRFYLRRFATESAAEA